MWAYFILLFITPFVCTAIEPQPIGMESRVSEGISANLQEPNGSSVKQVNGLWVGIVEGPGIRSLKEIQGIKDIDKCEVLFIHKTDIDKVEQDSLSFIPKLRRLAFIFNKKLTTLEKHCLTNPTLEWLLFFGNNITELPTEAFDLPNLQILLFANNNLQVVKANWGIKLPQLRYFYFIEKNMKAFEPGFLNGLDLMKMWYYLDNLWDGSVNFLKILIKGFLPGQKLDRDNISEKQRLFFYQLISTNPTDPTIFDRDLFRVPRGWSLKAGERY